LIPLTGPTEAWIGATVPVLLEEELVDGLDAVEIVGELLDALWIVDIQALQENANRRGTVRPRLRRDLFCGYRPVLQARLNHRISLQEAGKTLRVTESLCSSSHGPLGKLCGHP